MATGLALWPCAPSCRNAVAVCSWSPANVGHSSKLGGRREGLKTAEAQACPILVNPNFLAILDHLGYSWLIFWLIFLTWRCNIVAVEFQTEFGMLSRSFPAFSSTDGVNPFQTHRKNLDILRLVLNEIKQHWGKGTTTRISWSSLYFFVATTKWWMKCKHQV
jgi:hypothetical protein